MSYEILIKREKDITPKKDWRDDQLVTISIVKDLYASNKKEERKRERKFYQDMIDKEILENDKEQAFFAKIVRDMTSENTCNCDHGDILHVLLYICSGMILIILLLIIVLYINVFVRLNQ